MLPASKEQQRGIVRLVIAVVASYLWATGEQDQAMAAFVFGQALNGWLGLSA